MSYQFHLVPCNISSHHVNVSNLRRYAIRNHREICTVFAHIGEIPNLSNFWRNPKFIQLLEKSRIYPNFGEIPNFSHFWRIPCIFQNFRVFKKFPVQSSFRIPYKNSALFSKIPHSENYRCYKFRGFSQKIPCFTKFPGFHSFKSLENTRKNRVFLYKIRFKVYIFRLKNIYKRQGIILCIIFTIFSSFFSSSKKLCVNICFLRYFNT